MFGIISFEPRVIAIIFTLIKVQNLKQEEEKEESQQHHSSLPLVCVLYILNNPKPGEITWFASAIG